MMCAVRGGCFDFDLWFGFELTIASSANANKTVASCNLCGGVSFLAECVVWAVAEVGVGGTIAYLWLDSCYTCFDDACVSVCRSLAESNTEGNFPVLVNDWGHLGSSVSVEVACLV